MKLSDVTGIHPRTRTFLPSPEFVDPNCTVGVEIEVEGARYLSYSQVEEEYWTIKEDGSLRNGGRELTSKPLFGEDLLHSLISVCEVLKENNVTISERCGLHVHLDVSDFTVQELLSLSCIVALAEPYLFKYVGVRRKENIYCLPFCYTDMLVEYYNSIKGGNTSGIRSAIERTNKYSAFNILPLLSQGSVEFRHHGGTISFDAIFKWVNILMQLRKVAKEYSPTQIVNCAYGDTMDIIFGPYVEELCPDRQVDVDAWLFAKDILNYSSLDSSFVDRTDVYINEDFVTLRS